MMAIYIVFKCRHCGKAGTQMIYKPNRLNCGDCKKLALKCRYCNRSTAFHLAYIYEVFKNEPKVASVLMNNINLGKNKYVSLELQEVLMRYNKYFNEIEGSKAPRIQKNI